ncbi:lysozyme inhibitor LprI family protein [Cupriavidus sp. YAF13]|uniref:lysozyme inhibitor LprI family protein n=1 Tax=Cupriavidus sp. YAF13 TaxID=3233075 RepID=UPI003F93EBD4
MQNTQNQPIWNPSTVTGLSFILTPAFGACLQASNWKALGQPERAASSKVWFYISLLVLAGLAGLSVYAGGDETSRGLVNVVALAYFAVWYAVSGRLQVAHVKQVYGKTFKKRSLFKPVLIALALVIVYAGIIVGLLIATHGVAAGDDQAVGQKSATGSSGGSSFSLASLFSTGPKLDCAADSVKQNIAETYTDQLVKTGIPDLVSAVADNRVKVHVDAIRETSRNSESKNVDCAANLAIDFSNDDLVRATKQGEIFTALMQLRGFAPLSSPTFQAAVTYQVAVPADAAEKKNGLIVAMTTDEDAAVDRQLRTYATYYEVLSLVTPDITATSANTTPWGKEFKDGAIQSCSKSLGVERCTCRMNALAKVVSDKEMGRIGFAMQDSPIFAIRYVNFQKLVTALGQQCPTTQSLASILGDDGAASANAAPVTVENAATPVSDTAQQSAPQAVSAQSQPSQQDQGTATMKPDPAQSSQPAIVASFDCSKAASKIETLVCSSQQTADADRRLAAAYRAAASKSTDQAALKQQQRDWLKERNACTDAACLLNVTDARIQALSAM